MDLAIIEKAKTLPAAEAEKLMAGSGVEFHPIVCDVVTPGGCKHVSQSQRIERESAYAKAKAKTDAAPTLVEALAVPVVAAPVAEVPPELSIAVPPEPEPKPTPKAKRKR